MQKLSISEIREMLSNDEINLKTIKKLKNDERKGVIRLIEKWEKRQLERQLLFEKLMTMKSYERQAYEKGYKFIAGVDEVGRGPLAGPVIAAAVILPIEFQVLGINDSKLLTEEKRESLYKEIRDHALSIGVGIVPAWQIDEVNIYEASKLAMMKAIEKLHIKPDCLLVDAMKLPIDLPQQPIIKGDQKSVSIAASSIIAKVTRDRYMKELAEIHPTFGFERNMGYGTKQHLEAISTYGIISEHRKSFSPVKDAIIECKGG